MAHSAFRCFSMMAFLYVLLDLGVLEDHDMAGEDVRHVPRKAVGDLLLDGLQIVLCLFDRLFEPGDLIGDIILPDGVFRDDYRVAVIHVCLADAYSR